MRDDIDIRIETVLVECFFGRQGFVHADAGLVVEKLPVEVREFHLVKIGCDDGADAAQGQLHQQIGRAPDPATKTVVPLRISWASTPSRRCAFVWRSGFFRASSTCSGHRTGSGSPRQAVGGSVQSGVREACSRLDRRPVGMRFYQLLKALRERLLDLRRGNLTKALVAGRGCGPWLLGRVSGEMLIGIGRDAFQQGLEMRQ